MRLTLRTLLAYLDDLLEPSDARELGAKVRESEFASGLVHRLRSVVGRLRLSAPNVLGRGIGADANSVAEYLDNTFPPDRVPEFEKICLESDMHLAEVASCHQVLALVLGEPAQVSTRLRDRVHGLLPAANAPVPRPSSAAPDQAGSTTASRAESAAPQRPRDRDSSWRETESPEGVPDYVMAGRRGFPAWLSGLLAGFILTAVLVAGYMWMQSPTRESATGPAPPPLDADPQLLPGDAAIAAGTVAARDSTGNETADQPVSPTANIASDFEPIQDGAQGPLVPPLLMPADEAGSTTESQPGEAVADVQDRRDDLTADGAAISPGPDAIAAATEPAMEENPAAPPSSNDQPADQAREAAPGASPAVAPEPVAENVPAKTRDLGRFVSEDQLLAVWDEGQASWVRLPPRSALLSGIHLRVPTLFRPQLVLSNGLQVTLNDVTDVQLSNEAEGSVTIALDFGQAMVSSISGEDQQVVLQLAGEEIRVKLVDGLSQFAVDVRRVRLPGADPLAGPAPTIARIWPTGGSLEIQRGQEAAKTVAVGNVWVFDGQADVRPAGKLPPWITAPQKKEIDRMAQFRLATELGFDRALTLALAEAAADGPTETRSLAARVLASLDRFDTLVESFADPKQHFAWSSHYAALQDAIARSPQTAKLVHNSAQERWGADFEPMWQMIVGYDPEKLVAKGAGQLVVALENEQLEFRVIAIESLRAITGVDYFYEPQRLSRRRDSVRRWERELEAGRIKHKDWPPVLN